MTKHVQHIHYSLPPNMYPVTLEICDKATGLTVWSHTAHEPETFIIPIKAKRNDGRPAIIRGIFGNGDIVETDILP
jgi:hypothetical protein